MFGLEQQIAAMSLCLLLICILPAFLFTVHIVSLTFDKVQKKMEKKDVSAI